MLVLYVSATRRGPVGGLSWFLFARLRFARADLSVFAGTHESTQVRMEG